MATLSFCTKVQTVILITSYDTNYYHPYPFDNKPWEDLKEILKPFGIVISSPYEFEFIGDNYIIESIDKFFGANKANVLYKGKVIAKGCINGSNYCDKEGELTIYLDVLKSIYETK